MAPPALHRNCGISLSFFSSFPFSKKQKPQPQGPGVQMRELRFEEKQAALGGPLSVMAGMRARGFAQSESPLHLAPPYLSFMDLRTSSKLGRMCSYSSLALGSPCWALSFISA